MPEIPSQAPDVPLLSANKQPTECPIDESAEDEELLKQQLARLTPANADLLALADKSPPPPEWLDTDEECPF